MILEAGNSSVLYNADNFASNKSENWIYEFLSNSLGCPDKFNEIFESELQVLNQ